jgi:hypothetical protein
MRSRVFSFFIAFIVLSIGSIAAASAAPPPRANAADAWMETIRLLERHGYSHGVIVQSVAVPGGWIGSARRNDQWVEVAVDAKGNITERPRPTR